MFLACLSFRTVDSVCDGPYAVGPAPRYDIVDTCGRVKVTHGINNVVKGPPYFPASNFTPGGGSLSPVDAALLRSAGLNGVRLGVMWAGTVPSARGDVNHTYLAALVDTARTLYEAGLTVLLDAHQDGLSELFCDDGAPMWWAREFTTGVPGFPEPLGPAFPSLPPSSNECGEYAWVEMYLTNAVGTGFAALYNDTVARRDFLDFWAAVVTAFAAAPAGSVLGYEILNEPWAGDAVSNPLLLIPGVADNVTLSPFYDAVATAVRAAEAGSGSPTRLIFMEPVTWDETFPAGFSRDDAVWSSNSSVMSYQ